MADVEIEEIYNDNYELKLSGDFLTELKQRRDAISFSDVSLLKGSPYKFDISKPSYLPNGRLRIDIENARFECFFHEGKQKKLVIILGGARTRHGGKVLVAIPSFSRWSWYSATEYFWLCVEDPMYYIYEKLPLGWFYGDKTHNFRQYVAQIANAVASLYGIDKKDVIFYGGSGGGTAAIHAAALFEGGSAIAINAQYNFNENHKNIDNFVMHTGIDIRKEDDFHRNDIAWIINNHQKTKFIIVENCLSKWDYSNHLQYIADKLNFIPSYGISSQNNVIMYLYEAESEFAHSAFEDKNLFFSLIFLSKLAVDGVDIEPYKPLYKLFGEFWYEKYKNKMQVNKNKENDVAKVFVHKIPPLMLCPNNMICFFEANNIEIMTTNDNYSHYGFSNIGQWQICLVLIDGISISPAEEAVTIGVYDKTNKNFLIKEQVNIVDTNIKYAFAVDNNCQNIEFCVFAGKHGATAGKSLYIKQIRIYCNDK